MPTSELTRSVFAAPKMDCPTEERLVRMALDGSGGVEGIEVDLSERTVAVIHSSPASQVLEPLVRLDLGVHLVESAPLPASTERPTRVSAPGERRVLIQLLIINAIMFAGELVVGWWAQSTGLLADSLDMLADAFVYGVSLYAVGRALGLQHRAARLSGIMQLLLATAALTEVARRFVFGSEPSSQAMILMALVALVANVTCVALLHRHREGGLHMRASWIFSTNDAIANFGVILAGALVAATDSPIPDLVIGTIIALVVLRGAIRILRLKPVQP